MKMKEIYPKFPSAPPIDEGHGYRLQKINEIQTFLEDKIRKREALSKNYFTAAKIVDNVDTGLIIVTMVAGAGGIGFLSTVVAIPPVTTIGVAAFTGLLSLIGKYGVKKSTTKA